MKGGSDAFRIADRSGVYPFNAFRLRNIDDILWG